MSEIIGLGFGGGVSVQGLGAVHMRKGRGRARSGE